MKFAGKIALCSAVLGLFVISALAQAPKHGTINQRKQNQQKRIGQGVESGQLTARETRRLEAQESAINRQEARMKSDGNFTPRERARIQHEQNTMSRRIYRQKHDAQARPVPTTEIGARKEAQQQRIGEGIKSGELTAGEAARLENKEVKLNQETHAMREANGGPLTPAQKAKVNRQQNRVSRDIYRQKHDAQQQ